MNIIIYLVATAIGLFLSYVGIVFAMLSGHSFAYLVGGLLAAAHIVSFLYVYKKAKQGKGRQAAFVLASPLFIVMGVIYAFSLGKHALSFLETEPAAFTSACQTAGPSFYKLPTSPVNSIAYDWEQDSAPTYNYFKLGFGGQISSLGRSDFPYPNSIEFTERRHSDREGLPHDSPGPYVRFPRQGAFYGITELTADVLVKYQLTPTDELKKAATQQGMVVYKLLVTDRRDGEKLASLLYVIDAKNHRACGFTEKNEMNERSFVLRAIGQQ
jgi:hypothetical protein